MVKDIDLTLTRHPISGDVSQRKDVNAISQDIVNVTLASASEYKFDDYNIGAGMYDKHFKVSGTQTLVIIKDTISENIKTHCPLCELIDVHVSHDVQNGRLNAEIQFSMINSSETFTINVPIEIIK